MPAVSCASWMGMTLLFRLASGTKLLGVSSNHDVEASLWDGLERESERGQLNEGE